MRSPALIIIILLSILFSSAVYAQDPEFRQGAAWVIKLNSGLITKFNTSTPELYAGGLSFNPQFTVIKNLMRVGANAELSYADHETSGIFGPMVAVKIKTLELDHLSSYANIHLIGGAELGTRNQQMAVAGVALEALGRLHLGVVSRYDYSLNNWWIQSFIGYKLNRLKMKKDEYER
jgi:hypothetical protein